MVESVEVIVVGHVMCDDLSINDVALALLTDFVQSLIKKKRAALLKATSDPDAVNKDGGLCTCVSLAVEVLGARGLDREMVYMISRVWLPASPFFHGWYTTSKSRTGWINDTCSGALQLYSRVVRGPLT